MYTRFIDCSDLFQDNNGWLLQISGWSDIDMGRNACVKTCGVTYGNGSRESLSDADWVIDDFGSLLELIG